MKRKVLLVGDGNSPFMYYYAYWLANKVGYIVDVFSTSIVRPQNNSYYNQIIIGKYNNGAKICTIKHFGFLIRPFLINYTLRKELSKRKGYYDIVHFHHITANDVLKSSKYHQFSNKICATFWGGELINQKLLLSETLYNNKLKEFLGNIDCTIGIYSKTITTNVIHTKLIKNYPASFGSTPMEKLYNSMNNYSRTKAKADFNISTKKITVAICYSGKNIHRQIEILEHLRSSPYLNVYKDRIELLAPMTYGCSMDYCEQVNQLLLHIPISSKIYYGEFWSDEQIAIFRMTADILLQLSDFDAASNSINEFLHAGTIMISGRWLDYDVFKNRGFSFIQIDTFEAFDSALYQIIMNYSSCVEKYSNPNIDGMKQYFWSEKICDWIDAYEKILSE
jgi:hypothetical protein